jgi:hypothetical protein
LGWEGAAPIPQRSHIGPGPGLVDEDQSLRFDAALVFCPPRPPRCDVGAVAFASYHAFFTAGQKGDAPKAAALIEGLPAEVVMADTAYDADHLRQAIAAKGAIAVIPIVGGWAAPAFIYHAASSCVCCLDEIFDPSPYTPSFL